MRILFLLTQDLESPSGLGRYYPLAKWLVRRGHKVTIAALHADFGSLHHTHSRLEGVDVWYVASMHVLKRGNQKYYYPAYKLLPLTARATWSLSHAAFSVPADIVHVGKPHPMNSIAGLLAKRLQSKCVFLDCDDYEAASGHFNGGWQKPIVRFFEDFTPLHVDHITTHNSFLRDRLLTLGVLETQITCIPNGVDSDRFTPPDPQRVEALRTELDLSGKEVVAFIGSLSVPSHSIYLLLEAFAEVLRSRPDCVLLLVGGGEEYERVIQKVQHMGLSKAVRFTGRVPPEKAPLYYRLADVAVDPVEEDPATRGRLPLKLFESWISGATFVTGDVGDRRSLLGTPPAGMLASPGDSSSLSECILYVLRNPDAALEMRQQGLERVKFYTWDRLSQIMEGAYLQVLAARSRAKAAS